ncbi:sigma E positive regulator RseC/MucC [Prosthecochloris sp. GSB1]|nr:sigma E positive regulator RseC/MucC [Prosthecochloris sp. GSB1]
MHARVVKTYDGKAEVELNCSESSKDSVHCGACSMSSRPSGKRETVIADNAVGAKTGDIVICELKEHAEIKSALLLLIGPLVLFMITLGTAGAMGMELWQSFIAGLTVLALTYVVLQRLLKNKTYYYIEGIK